MRIITNLSGYKLISQRGKEIYIPFFRYEYYTDMVKKRYVISAYPDNFEFNKKYLICG